MPGCGSVPLRFRCPYYRLSTRSVHVGMTEGLSGIGPDIMRKRGERMANDTAESDLARLARRRIIDHMDCDDCTEDYVFLMRQDDREFDDVALAGSLPPGSISVAHMRRRCCADDRRTRIVAAGWLSHLSYSGLVHNASTVFMRGLILTCPVAHSIFCLYTLTSSFSVSFCFFRSSFSYRGRRLSARSSLFDLNIWHILSVARPYHSFQHLPRISTPKAVFPEIHGPGYEKGPRRSRTSWAFSCHRVMRPAGDAPRGARGHPG